MVCCPKVEETLVVSLLVLVSPFAGQYCLRERLGGRGCMQGRRFRLFFALFEVFLSDDLEKSHCLEPRSSSCV